MTLSNADANGPTTSVSDLPDINALAAFLSTRHGADTIIEVGCGDGHRLIALEGFRRVGIDRSSIIERCRQTFPAGTWIETAFETDKIAGLAEELASPSVIVCTNVFGLAANPAKLLACVSEVSRRARAVLLAAPPIDAARALFDAFGTRLAAAGLKPIFLGLTAADQSRKKAIPLAIIDPSLELTGFSAPGDFRPLAIVATYNDRDIISQSVSKLLDDGFDVHAIDDWSQDGTYEILQAIVRSRPNLTLECFPAAGPSRYYEWGAILDRKDQIAQRHPGRWIVHHDSDEIRSSPWPDVSFRAGLYAAERAGFDAVDFTVCDFRPVDDRFAEGDDLEVAFAFFDFGRRPGHFVQVKAWRQPTGSVNLRASGGHEARFAGRRIFPYKFLLKHYPLRNPEQARRKIFSERYGRFSPEERAAGWHIQYDQWRPQDRFLWEPDALIFFDEQETRRSHLVELISGVGIAR